MTSGPGSTASKMHCATAIVVAFLSADVIRGCIESLVSNDAVHRILIVNNSPDDLSEAVEGVPRTTVIQSAANLGFGPGVNSVRKLVRTPYVIIANPDTAVSSGRLEAVFDEMERDQRIGLVGPRLLFPAGALSRSSQLHLTLPRMLGERLGMPAPFGLRRSERVHATSHEAEVLLGAFMIARREALDAVDWFDPAIFLLGEDQDLCRRVQNAGYQVRFDPTVTVTHRTQHARRQGNHADDELLVVARERELRRNGRDWQARLYRLMTRRRRASQDK